MIEVAIAFVRGSGRARMILIAIATAVASALLMVAVAMAQLPSEPAERLFNLVDEPGLRVGTVFATVLLVLPLLLLLYQAVRLGTASRERRLAALRVAGATPREIRLLGAFEVGVPVLAGAVLGLAVYGFLRVILGGTPSDMLVEQSRPIGLVPTTVTPTWWQFLAIIGAVTALGLVTGWRASRRVVVTPLGVARRQTSTPPRPWGLLLAGAALVLVIGAATLPLPHGSLTPIGLAVVLSVVLGVVSLAPWLAFRIGRWLANRSGSPVTLLAARQLATESRPAGRAAAAVGAIGLIAGGAAGIGAELFVRRGWEPFYVTSYVLVGAALLIALIVTTSTLAVHGVESLLDRRRALAALVAAGAEQAVVHAAQRRAAVLVAVPLAGAGAILGAFVVGRISMYAGAALLAGLLVAAATALLTWAATHLAAGIVKPWLIEATAPTNLRSE